MSDHISDLKEREKREKIMSQMMISKQSTRLSTLETDNEWYKERIKTLQKEFKQQKDKDLNLIKHQIREINEFKDKRTSLEKEIKRKNKQIQELKAAQETKVKDIIQKFNDELESTRTESEDRLRKLNNLNSFAKDKVEIEIKLQRLTEELQEERKEKIRELSDKDREKIQATERLRKDMLYKIKETKANLLALNDEQLHTTTRLTILQNHQLTTELEYQSKQTEKLLFKNNKFQEQISTLKRDIEIHKQVENELAKRSHFCQKVIQKLNQRIKTLEQESKDALSPGKSEKNIRNKKENKKDSDELVNYLEFKLGEVERKLEASQNDGQALQKDFSNLQEQLEKMRDKYGKAALLLTEFLDNLITDTPNILNDEKDLYLDLDRIKSIPVEELEKEEKAALVLVLLKQLQPFLSDINLSVSKTSHPQAQNLNKFLNNVNIQRQFGGSQIKEDKEFDTQVDESESSSQRDKATLEDSPGASFLPPIQSGKPEDEGKGKGKMNNNKSYDSISNKQRYVG